MIVSVVVIIINTWVVLPRIVDFSDPKLFEVTQGKLALIFMAVFYFSVIYGVVTSDTKPHALLNSSSEETDENGAVDMEMKQVTPLNEDLSFSLIDKHELNLAEPQFEKKLHSSNLKQVATMYELLEHDGRHFES